MNEAPPHFSPPPGGPVRKKTPVLWIVLGVVLFSCIGICGVGAFFLYGVMKKAMPMAACMISFEEARQSLVLYSKEHDGKLPPAEKWQDEVRSYFKQVKNRKGNRNNPFKTLDPDGLWGCNQGDNKPMTGMAFNSDLSNKKVADLKDQYGTTLIFEVPAATMNAHEPYVARDPESGPEFVAGAHRPWLRLPIRGQAPEMNTGKSGRWQFSGNEDFGTTGNQDFGTTGGDSATPKKTPDKKKTPTNAPESAGAPSVD